MLYTCATPGDGGPELSIAKRVDRSGAERAAALAAEQAVRDMASITCRSANLSASKVGGATVADRKALVRYHTIN